MKNRILFRIFARWLSLFSGKASKFVDNHRPLCLTFATFSYLLSQIFQLLPNICGKSPTRNYHIDVAAVPNAVMSRPCTYTITMFAMKNLNNLTIATLKHSRQPYLQSTQPTCAYHVYTEAVRTVVHLPSLSQKSQEWPRHEPRISMAHIATHAADELSIEEGGIQKGERFCEIPNREWQWDERRLFKCNPSNLTIIARYCTVEQKAPLTFVI